MSIFETEKVEIIFRTKLMCSEPMSKMPERGVTRARTFCDGVKDYSAFVNFDLV
jgi:hypothetical protein